MQFNFDWRTPEDADESNKALTVLFGMAEMASETARSLRHIARTVQAQLDAAGLKLKQDGG